RLQHVQDTSVIPGYIDVCRSGHGYMRVRRISEDSFDSFGAALVFFFAKDLARFERDMLIQRIVRRDLVPTQFDCNPMDPYGFVFRDSNCDVDQVAINIEVIRDGCSIVTVRFIKSFRTFEIVREEIAIEDRPLLPNLINRAWL